MKKEQELEAERQRMRKEMAALELKHKAEVKSLEDANYANFKDSFDEAVTQVKHFNKEVPNKFLLVNQEKKLDEILG